MHTNTRGSTRMGAVLCSNEHHTAGCSVAWWPQLMGAVMTWEAPMLRRAAIVAVLFFALGWDSESPEASNEPFHTKGTCVCGFMRSVPIIEFDENTECKVLFHESVKIILAKPNPGERCRKNHLVRWQVERLRILTILGGDRLESITPNFDKRAESQIVRYSSSEIHIRPIPSYISPLRIKLRLSDIELVNEWPLFSSKDVELALECGCCLPGFQPGEKCEDGQQQSETGYGPMRGMIVPKRPSAANDPCLSG